MKLKTGPTGNLKKVSARVPQGAAEWYAARFRTLSAGAEYALKTFPRIIEEVLDELKTTYTASQLKDMRELMREQISDGPRTATAARPEAIKNLMALSYTQQTALLFLPVESCPGE